MKLNFSRNDKDEVNISIVASPEQTVPFNYVSLVDFLYKGEEISSVDYDGEFSDLEKERIGEMLTKINSAVSDNIDEIIEDEVVETIEEDDDLPF